MSDLTITAKLRDHLTGPAKKGEKALEDLGKAAETSGKKAEQAHAHAGKAAEKQARDTATAGSKMERAFRALEGSGARMGRALLSAWDEAASGPARAVHALSTAGTRMEADSRRIGKRVGSNLGNGIQAGIDNIDISNLTTALGGLTVAGGVAGSMDQDRVSRRLAAAEGVDAGAMRDYIRGAYQDGLGADYASLGVSAGAIIGTFDLMPGSPEAEALLRGNVTMEEAWGLDPNQLSMAVKIMSDVDGVSLSKAQGILGEALQKAAPQGRDEMLDNIQEYATLLEDTGISASALVSMLSNATGSGAMASDKTGDAIKEFTVRAIDPAYGKAYDELGLDQSAITRRLVSGDATAFTDVAKVLDAIEDPFKQRRLAVEAFGTPLEDLGVGKIDEIVASWAELDTTITGTRDTLDGMTRTMTEGVAYDFDTAWRQLSGAMTDVGDAAAPLISVAAKTISLFAKPIAWGAGLLTAWGVLSRIPGGAAAAKWAVSGLWKVFTVTPLGRAVAIIGGVAAGFKWLYDNVELVRDGTDWLYDSLYRLFGVFDSIGEKIDAMVQDKLPALHSAMTFGSGATEGDSRSWGDRILDAGSYLGESMGLPDLGGGRGERADRFSELGFLPAHADGDWTASGAHLAVVGEEGREFVVQHWASEKLAANNPGALEHINRTGTLPASGSGGTVVTTGDIHLHVPQGTDGRTFADQFVEQMRNWQAGQSLAYATPYARGAN